MSNRCLTGDDSQASYQKMVTDVLSKDVLQMSYKRCLADILFSLKTYFKIKLMSQFCLINRFNEYLLSI